MLDQITPVILTRDEDVNIARTLGQLEWANEVLVVDSMSTDATLDIARRHPNVRIVQREFDSLSGQTQFALQQARTPWVLFLDADYFVPAELVDELRVLEPPENVGAYRAEFRYAIGGRPLHASLYPARPVLLRRANVRVWQEGHTQRIGTDLEMRDLRTKIVHDDRKSFARFLARQKRYMREEAEMLRATPSRALPFSGRIRKLVVVAPLAVVAHTLFVKGVIRDGVPGLRYTWERFVAELILARELMRRR